MAAGDSTVGCEISTGNDCELDFYCGKVQASSLFAARAVLPVLAVLAGGDLRRHPGGPFVAPRLGARGGPRDPPRPGGLRRESHEHAGETDPGTAGLRRSSS